MGGKGYTSGDQMKPWQLVGLLAAATVKQTDSQANSMNVLYRWHARDSEIQQFRSCLNSKLLIAKCIYRGS